MSHATPVRRRFALLLVFAAATSLAWTESQPESPSERPESARQETTPTDSAERPVAPPDAIAPQDGNTPAPAQPPAAAPSREATKPARPANKQRPAWPPPPELIS